MNRGEEDEDNVPAAPSSRRDGRIVDFRREKEALFDPAPLAAERAAAAHEQAGSDETIEYEDQSGTWHEERASGDARPQTDVKE